MKALDLTPYLMENGQVQSYAWPGEYPLYYLCADNGVLCPACVNKERELIDAMKAEADSGEPWPDKQWLLVAADVNYEDSSLYCDHCNKQIESAYADDDAMENDEMAEETRKNREPIL